MKIEIDDSFDRLPETINDIPRIAAKNLSFKEFFDNFMSKNLPVIITDANIYNQSLLWLNIDKSININKLEELLTDHEVPVANCSKQYLNSHEKSKMKFKDYANYWRHRDKNADLLYLKDFHLKHEFPHVDFYNVPEYFASDWLNEYLLDKGREDYRFVYLGVEGTFTNFHSDVTNSYSWSANVSGQKQWFILPRNEERKLKDNFGKLPFILSEEMLIDKNVKFFNIVQNSNEIIFVPSGWFHQVHNLTDVLSFNHNWFNGCNIQLVLQNLLKNLQDIKKEIEDCRDMENFDDHCQLMMKAVYGMNLVEFVNLVLHIFDERVKNCDKKVFSEFSLGENLQRFDLKMADEVLNDLLESEIADEDLKKIFREQISTLNLNK